MSQVHQPLLASVLDAALQCSLEAGQEAERKQLSETFTMLGWGFSDTVAMESPWTSISALSSAPVNHLRKFIGSTSQT